MGKFQREVMINFIILVCLSIYSYASTAPSDILNKQVKNNFILNDNTAIVQLDNRSYYKQLQNKYSNIISFIEDKDNDYVYIYLGFDESSHTTRHAFVRVNHNGIVYFRTIAPAEESDWKIMQ